MSNKTNWLVGRMGPRQKAKARARLPQVYAHCGSEQNLTLDHQLARAQGGTNHISNLQMLCAKCNVAKSLVEQQLAAVLRETANDKNADF